MRALTPKDRAQDVLGPVAKAAIFLTLGVRPGKEEAVRSALEHLWEYHRAVSFKVPEAQLSVVAGIGSDLWDRMYADIPKPRGLHPFVQLEGGKHTAVSTPGDLFFHLRSMRMDMCFELASQLMNLLGNDVYGIDEVQAFRYYDDRDLLGFVDGTENPPAGYAQEAATLIPDGDPFVGGSYVIIQKYLHNMEAWNSLSVEQQELVIGRKKLEDIELPDDVKPVNSHVAVNTITGADGEDREIVRDNLPFGNVATGEFGTFFIAYSAYPEVTELMLQRMFIGEPEGNYDAILDFSTAETGCLFFVPPGDFFEDPSPYATPDSDDADAAPVAQGADPIPLPIDPPEGAPALPALGEPPARRNPERAADAPVQTTVERDARPDASAQSPSEPSDGSLGIGSLKRSDQS